jgi:hypothetical protein
MLTVWEYLQRVIASNEGGLRASEQQARNLAGAFLFSGNEQEKCVGNLSGGERGRMVIAGLVSAANNLIVLDEPTNHLDIPSAERLEMALSTDPDDGGYDGSLILISHDRAMLAACCNRLLILDGEGNGRARFRTFDDIIVAVTVRTTEPVDDPVFGIALFRDDGTYVFGPNTRYDGVLEGRWHGVYTWFLRYPAIPLLQGTYRLSVAFFDRGHIRPLVWHNQLYELRITQDLEDHGLVHLPHRWGVLSWYER